MLASELAQLHGLLSLPNSNHYGLVTKRAARCPETSARVEIRHPFHVCIVCRSIPIHATLPYYCGHITKLTKNFHFSVEGTMAISCRSKSWTFLLCSPWTIWMLSFSSFFSLSWSWAFAFSSGTNWVIFLDSLLFPHNTTYKLQIIMIPPSKLLKTKYYPKIITHEAIKTQMLQREWRFGTFGSQLTFPSVGAHPIQVIQPSPPLQAPQDWKLQQKVDLSFLQLAKLW